MFPLKLEALLMASFGFFQGYMAPMQLGKEDNSGNFLQEYTVGISVVAYGGILTSLVFLVKEWEQKGFQQPRGIFLISFQIRGQ